ncbi:hypothetical protein JCM3766R1_003403 [Sporobolomyces carnicolor]
MASHSGIPPLNPRPFATTGFTRGLEALGYREPFDTSEAKGTERYQHGLEEAHFAAHSEEFCRQQGVRKVHRSVVRFFLQVPTRIDPFVHILVDTLPPRDSVTVTPLRSRVGSTWVPIGSKYEAEGTIHFTVSIRGFFPITVVFDSNQNDLAEEDRYPRITPDDNSDSDPEEYLDSGRGAYYDRASSRVRRSLRSGRAFGYRDAMRSSARSSRRRCPDDGGENDKDDENEEHETSDEVDDEDRQDDTDSCSSSDERELDARRGSCRGSIPRSSRHGSTSRGVENMSGSSGLTRRRSLIYQCQARV